MGFFKREGDALLWRANQETVWITPCGVNGLRVRANLAGGMLDLPQGLLAEGGEAPGRAPKPLIEIGEREASISNGLARATVAGGGRIRFFDASTGAHLMGEPEWIYHAPPNRHYLPQGGGGHAIHAWFESFDGERIWGLGQHQHGRLDQKGCVVELHHRNTEVAIPFLVSSRGYGFIWNNPAVGRVELGCNATRWVADLSRQLDYCVIREPSCAGILHRYADLTGHAPVLPEWAAGFWQCKLRYETQDQLMTVAREYWKRGLPLSVIVSDFFNWTLMGDWKFDPACWPDPAAMERELESHGARCMVSIWPTVNPHSPNFPVMRERGLLINNELGTDAQHVFIDNGEPGATYFSYYDATNPEARAFLWETVRKTYYAQGVKLYWLDNDEPDVNPWDPRNLRYHLGNGAEVGSIYPLLHQKGFHDGLRSAGEKEIVTLSRSGWLGSQRYSSVIWSGDIASTFEALRAQIRAGLNMAMSGIPWWTTDIGGFHAGDINAPSFRELIVRWFQYGVFCPIFRLHGHRLPLTGPMPGSGADNEVWSFGDEAYGVIRGLMFLRERLRPYIMEQMKKASDAGLPPMRPLFVDFPDDPACQAVDDQFLFGPDVLVAPVLHEGAREREVVLPAGVKWTDAWTGKIQGGGKRITVLAPLERIPVFLREGSKLRGAFKAGE